MLKMNEVKICKKCGRELPLTEKYYPKDKGCKDGFRNVCRECQTGHSSGFLKDDYKKPSKWTDDDINLLDIIEEKASSICFFISF